ncbi:dienelactone hydrolase [Colletotrichum orchidophilum]|uniref:Dienelactone hydrolase n=1 Tax=Colletotrichum orchidophilum TaxID=1209926 RepID=A0A1G4AV08_9PEZI|nr:dienelactone hydrolase [Colletotrichum orchidophilum]OHE92892.1 dienelactone hydrolase [Colletotrichum orchidophilum]
MSSKQQQAPRFCADCFKGTLRGDVEPRGTEETLYGLPTYVARPEPGRGEPAGVVVILPDVFGWTLRNSRALADAYANRIPAVVLLPELMNGHAIPDTVLALGDGIQGQTSWWKKYLYIAPVMIATVVRYFIPLVIATRSGVIVPRIKNYLRAVRLSPPSPLPPHPSSSSPPSVDTGASAPKAIKVGVAGFCWGGKFVVQLCQLAAGPFGGGGGGSSGSEGEGERLIDCGFTAHPSFLTLPKDLETVVLPLSVANGDDDMMMPRAKMVEAKELLGKKGGDFEIVEYPGAKHGFAVRGDPNDQRQADFGMRAEDQAVGWFRRWFGQGAE